MHDMAGETLIGHISHYFGKIQVAAIELTDGDLSVGDTIHIVGHTSDFTEEITSMQIDRVDVAHADKGRSIGIRVKEHARVGDKVFKVEA
jgi:translation initiation factor IF-2